MQNTTNILNNKSVKSITAAIVLAASMLTVSTDAAAYDLKSNTIYANASGGIYEIDLNTTVATKVADTNASLSSIQDIAFDGDTLYGINLHWQLLKLEPGQDMTVAVNEASSYSLQFRGLEARDGVLYGAETNLLVTIDQQTAAPGSLGPGSGSYGLGAGEVVTDLAFAADGTLYASVQFPGIAYSYLGTISLDTGELMLVGNTGVENITAVTVKDAVIYALDKAGDLYTVNEVSGFASGVASGVLPGVNGMDTSPVTVANAAGPAGGTADGSDEGGAGSLSLYWMLIIAVAAAVRRIS